MKFERFDMNTKVSGELIKDGEYPDIWGKPDAKSKRMIERIIDARKKDEQAEKEYILALLEAIRLKNNHVEWKVDTKQDELLQSWKKKTDW